MNTNQKTRSDAIETSTSNGGMKTSQFMKLFEDELKNIYWAEKALF